MQPYGFFEVEQQVHVMNRLPARAFQKIVDDGYYQQLAFNFLQVNQTFIRIDNLFQIRVFIYNKSKRMVIIIFIIELPYLVEFNFAIHISGSKNSARKITANRYKIN